jgi:sugar lactone lactonase YvrE
MSHSTRTRLVLGPVLVATALSAGASAQGTAHTANALPNPYKVVENFFRLPEGRKMGSAPGIHIDPDGSSIWTFDRCGGNDCYSASVAHVAPIQQFDASGRLVKSFGAGMFLRPHGIYVHTDGTVWVTDGEGPDGKDPNRNGKGHQVFKFSPEGKLLMTLGTAGVAGEGPNTFNKPSDVVVAPNGDIFVGDGHGGNSNARIVKFSKDGTFIKAWGKRGAAPGDFEEPHSLAMDSRGRLFVGDTGNFRVQVFDQDGTFLEEWKQFGRASGLYIDKNDRIYAADTSNEKSNPGFTHGIHIGSARDGRISEFIVDTDPDPSIEGVTADAKGNVYGALTNGMALRKYARR